MDQILFYLIGLGLLILVGKILVIPLKTIMKLIGNGIVGGITLLIFNMLGGIFGLNLLISPLNALVVGFLGVPGVIVLLILQVIS